MTLPTLDTEVGRRYWGKFPGRVADNQDPTNRGRIQVSVPGIREEDPAAGAEGSTPFLSWAVPCLPPGFFVIPDIDALVWVEFGGGDLDHPIWTGVWYQQDGTPPNIEGDPPTPEQKIVRTTSGQVIQLEDTDGGERTVLRDEANDHRITMDADGIRFEDAHGNRIVMESSGIRVEDAAGNVVELSGSGIVATEAGGQSELALTGSAAELKVATSMLSIEASRLALSVLPHELSMEAAGTTLTDATTLPQPIVLKPIYQWLALHMHIGNMGAPTPMLPAPPLAAWENALGVSKP